MLSVAGLPKNRRKTLWTHSFCPRLQFPERLLSKELEDVKNDFSISKELGWFFKESIGYIFEKQSNNIL